VGVRSALLWLAQPRSLGEPSVASVPLGDVGEAAVRTRRSRDGGPDVAELHLALGGRTLRHTAIGDADACRTFVDVLRSAQRRS
jgi:hypothetical protein